MRVLNSVCLVPSLASWISCHRAFAGKNFFVAGNLCVRHFFSYFIGPKLVLVGISWVQNFYSWLFHGSNFFFGVISWITLE